MDEFKEQIAEAVAAGVSYSFKVAESALEISVSGFASQVDRVMINFTRQIGSFSIDDVGVCIYTIYM